MLKHYKIADGKLLECGPDNGQVLYYISPDEAERRHLVDDRKLDEHTLNSALDPDEVSRLEFEPEHVAVIFKRPKNYSSEDNFQFKVCSTGLFIFKDQIILVTAEEAPLFEGRQFQRITGLRDLILRLIYRSVFHFIEHLRVINMISASLEQQINTSMENKHLLNMFTLEKSLVYYLNAINSNGSVIDRLKTSAVKLGFLPENIEFLDDLIIENTQCARQAEIYSSVLAGLMDARASVVANNLNLLIKTLTIITIAIMLPTLVVSIFSMNLNLPLPRPEVETHWPFWTVLALAIGSSIGVYWWVKFKKI
ncbi:MAG: magnesium transporter CorA family protein [Phycisphaerae bacterium]|nr:magnesium transporter CorA family protein [Phycisphaerae bacterium]